jgi:hypothetical protein
MEYKLSKMPWRNPNYSQKTFHQAPNDVLWVRTEASAVRTRLLPICVLGLLFVSVSEQRLLLVHFAMWHSLQGPMEQACSALPFINEELVDTESCCNCLMGGWCIGSGTQHQHGKCLQLTSTTCALHIGLHRFPVWMLGNMPYCVQFVYIFADFISK